MVTFAMPAVKGNNCYGWAIICLSKANDCLLMQTTAVGIRLRSLMVTPTLDGMWRDADSETVVKYGRTQM